MRWFMPRSGCRLRAPLYRPSVALPGDELGERFRGQRLARPVTLEAMAAAHVEELELLARADAFRDHLQAEAACEADDGLGDGGIARVGLQVRDERDVDLQRVDREMLQVRE